MNKINLLFFLIASAAIQSKTPSVLGDISTLKWINRVVVIDNLPNQDKFLALLEKYYDRVNDRQIIWLVFQGDQTLTNYPGSVSTELIGNTKRQYRLGQGKVILIGKDGGVKSTYDHVDLNAIFSDIDAMPMRQKEKKN